MKLWQTIQVRAAYNSLWAGLLLNVASPAHALNVLPLQGDAQPAHSCVASLEEVRA